MIPVQEREDVATQPIARQSRRRRDAAFWRRYALLAGLMLVALLMRLPWLTFPGFGGDPHYFGVWSALAQQDFFHIYSASARLPEGVPGSFANYPPGMMLLLLAIRSIYQLAVGASTGIPPGSVAFDAARGAPLVALKLAFAGFDLASAWMIFHLAWRRASEEWAFVAAAIYVLLPATIYDSAIWGQADGVAAALLLGVLWQIDRCRPIAAGMVFALTIMVKIQPCVIAPVLFLWIARVYGWRTALKSLGAAGLVVLTLLGPFCIVAVPGQSTPEAMQFIHNVLYIQQLNEVNSWTAYNLWWLLGLQRIPGTTPLLGPLDGDAIGIILFAACLAVGLEYIWRRPRFDTLVGTIALVTFAFFFVTTTQHERYLFPALAPMVMFQPGHLRAMVAALAAQFTAFLNMAITHPLHGFSRFPASVPALLAATNLLLFASLFAGLAVLESGRSLERQARQWLSHRKMLVFPFLNKGQRE
jgi:Gpi18-like mannosyltransferase